MAEPRHKIKLEPATGLVIVANSPRAMSDWTSHASGSRDFVLRRRLSRRRRHSALRARPDEGRSCPDPHLPGSVGGNPINTNACLCSGTLYTELLAEAGKN